MRFFHRDYDFLDTVRRAVASQADAFAERKITLLEELPRGPLPGYGDSERLGRAIVQLLDNAAKFTPEGGIVGVLVRPLEAHVRARRRRHAARASRPSAPSGSSSRSTRSTARRRARTAASASASRSRGASRAGSAATCKCKQAAP